jgi:hypothetical protein
VLLAEEQLQEGQPRGAALRGPDLVEMEHRVEEHKEALAGQVEMEQRVAGGKEQEPELREIPQ